MFKLFSLSKNKFNEHYPHLKHILFAVKAIGSEIRKQYLSKGKFGAVYSYEFVKGETSSLDKWLHKMATALGVTLGMFKTTFVHETQADLYSEQGLLCSVITAARQVVMVYAPKSFCPLLTPVASRRYLQRQFVEGLCVAPQHAGFIVR